MVIAGLPVRVVVAMVVVGDMRVAVDQRIVDVWVAVLDQWV